MDFSGINHNVNPLEEAGFLISGVNNNTLELLANNATQSHSFDIEHLEEIELLNTSSEYNLDIDGNRIIQRQDYNLINLYAEGLDAEEFDVSLNNFPNDLLGDDATRTDADAVLGYLNEARDSLLDIDNNNLVELQDYNLINLYAAGLDEAEFEFLLDNFSNDVLGEEANRIDADSILNYFETISIIPEELEKFSVMPGDRLEIDLSTIFTENTEPTYLLSSEQTLPTGMLEGNNRLVFNPNEQEIGNYEFTVTAVEGETETETRKNFLLEVVADTVTTTRISGIIENTDQEPLEGVVIELGNLQTLTNANGEFIIETPGELPDDTLKIRGETITGDVTYPFIAEKLPLLLERDAITGVNNVISRPIYLPPIDMANAVTIDPNVNVTVTTDNIPNASVFVAAQSLETPEGEAYTGQLSITEVPRELTPAALPNNLMPDMVVTIQPGEMVFTTPAPLSLPNLAGYEPGTEMDLWSINPETGLFDNVGTGQVSNDGTVIETIDGGINNSSWHFFSPPPPVPKDPNDDPYNHDPRCNESETSAPSASEVQLHSGAVIESHDLVSYQSLGVDRGLSLVYDSQRADARPIVNFGYSDVSGNFGPNAPFRLLAELTFKEGRFEYQVPGFAGGEYGLDGGEHFWTLPAFGTDIDAALQADLRFLDSGRYDYELTTGLLRFNNSRFTGSTSTVGGSIIHVNSVGSPFGNGWGLADWLEIVENADGSVLMIDGDGGELLFEPSFQEVVVNGFDTDNQGWTIEGDGNGPNYIETGGNPGGYISASDQSTGATWFWKAPTDFLTELTDSYGSLLSFDLKQSAIDRPYDDDDVVLTGNGITLTFDTLSNPGIDWTNYQINLDDSAGWVNQETGELATREEIESVLSSLDNLLIRGEYRVGGDTGDLDNVQILRLRSFGVFESPPGDFSTLEKLEDGTFRRTMTDQMVYTFNTDNKIASVSDRNGNTTEYLYNNEGNISTIIDPVGLETTFTYTNGLVTSIIDPADRETVLEYDTAGNLMRITDPDGTLREWSYDEDFRMVSETDKRGNLEQTFYDFAGRADSAILKDGATIDFNPVQVQGLYEPDTTIDPLNAPEALQLRDIPESTYIDVNGNAITYRLDQAGQTIDSFDEVGLLPAVERNEENLITRSIDARGNVTTFTYDEQGNVTTRIQPNQTLIVNGISNSSETDVTSRSTNNLTTILENTGVKVIVSDSLPNDLSQFNQIWDIRFDNSSAISTLEETRYLSFLQSGGQIFLIGENGRDDFVTRNESVINLIEEAGGGELNYFAFPFEDITQEVLPPFNTPNPIIDNDISYNAPGGVLNPGNGEFITVDSSGRGTAIFFEKDDLLNAPNGQLTTIFDINFMERSLEQPDFQNLLTNLILLNLFQEQFTYDPTFNQLTSYTDELGHQTLYDIDPNNGNVLSITEVIGEVGGNDDLITQFTYTSNGLVDTITDALGRVTDNDYDTFGRLISMTYAVGTSDEATRQFEYDTVGNQTAIIDENGNRTEFEYDALNRLISVTEADPDGEGPLTSPITTYTYDADGNLLTTTDPENSIITNEYDVLNRLIQTTDSLNQVTTFTYDSIGNLLSVVDPLGNETQNIYDERYRLIETIDPDGGITQFNYDLDNNLTSVIDTINNETSFTYDARNRLISETDPFNNTTTYEYDLVDNLIAQTDRNNRRIEYQYDDIDRLIQETWIDTEQVINYSYDPVSNLISVMDQYSSLTYTYDNRDRLITADNLNTPNTPHVTLTYTYDDVGNMLSVVDTINGVEAGTNNYNYDALNRLIELTQFGNNVNDKSVNFAYNALGQYTSISRYSDLARTQLVNQTNYNYDDLNRLTNIGHNNGTNDIAFYNYGYDASSRITQITDVDGVTDYSYDDRDQLIGAERSNDNLVDETYEYDANGNRISSSLHENSYETGTANRLLSDGVYNYDYDNEGNLISKTEIATGNSQEFEWDYRNRLIAVIDKDSDGNELQRVEFVYDALNRRISKTVDTTPLDGVAGVVTHFVYNGDDVHLEFVDNDGITGENEPILSQRYLHGAGVDQVLAQEDGNGNVIWMLTDHLGTIRDLVDENGILVNHLTYDSFGQVIAQTDPSVDTRYLFTGREFDEAIGLYYYRARYYDASIGRFIGEDPIGFAGGDVNLYRYVGNDPLSFTDPSGNIINFAIGGISSVAMGYLISRLTGSCYTLKDAIFDATTGAIGAGIAAKAGKLLQLGKRVGTPNRVARVIDSSIKSPTLGRPGASEVFVAAADDIKYLNANQLASRLGIDSSKTGKFTVIEFDVPSSALRPTSGMTPGANSKFIPGGYTSGGAREYAISNQPIPSSSSIYTIGNTFWGRSSGAGSLAGSLGGALQDSCGQC